MSLSIEKLNLMKKYLPFDDKYLINRCNIKKINIKSIDKPLQDFSLDNDIFKKIKEILNKLTGTNYDIMFNKLINILYNEESFGNHNKIYLVNILFEKIQDEPSYGSLYIKLCSNLDKMGFNILDNLIEKCLMFIHNDSNFYIHKNFEKNSEKSDEKLVNLKRKTKNLIYFICILFNKKLISMNDIDEIILLMSIENSEHDMEILSRIILDSENILMFLNYIDKLVNILDNNVKLSYKIKFLILDIIDKRNKLQ